MTKMLKSASILLVAVLAPLTYAATASPEEMGVVNRWVAAKIQGKPQSNTAQGYLMVYNKSGSVARNGVTGIRGHFVLRIADKKYQRGLHMPSVGRVVVHLPGPAKSFNAEVGVDSNDKGYSSNQGQGNVVASVEVDGKVVFHSPVMREGMPETPVQVNLGGATEFTLDVSNPEGQNEWDQADWAEGKVTLADGSTVWLADLPIGPLPAPESVEPPFSFRYGDRPSSELLKIWESKRGSRELDEQRTEHTLTFTDPKTGLEVRCVAVVYRDFPTVEWTVYFKNTSGANSPILEDIQALDTRLERNGEGEFVLHHFNGALAQQDDYEPFETALGPGVEKRIATSGGRPSNSALPYFNLASPGEGEIIVVGWPGQWAATFTRNEGNGVAVRAGQELTHLKLLPGEEIRTPLMVMEFYKGDWIRGQNLWRHWMIAHNMPKMGDRLRLGQLAGGSCPYYGPYVNNNEENQKLFIDRYAEEGVKLDYWWIDAGWYPTSGVWTNTGTWEVDTKRFPRGLRGVADYAHSKGLKFIVWFEPERVTPGTWLYDNHQDWLLKAPSNPGDQLYVPEWRLLNFGKPEAWQWSTEHFNKLITDNGIDLYRQDFNMAPLYFWRANDADDRQGITEIRYVTGYLAYWDDLRRNHPGMPIDSCASGGRRNDVETLRRSVPLTRSDNVLEPIGQQGHTYGIAFWMPYYGTIADAVEPYAFRSEMCPALHGHWDMRRRDVNYGRLRDLVAQWRQIAPNYFGDYYPLTPYSRANDIWVAWQFDRPEAGEGVVQAFRRADSSYESARFKLRGLDPSARYTITNADAPGGEERTGRELMEQGLSVTLRDQPGAAVVSYRKR